MKLFSKMAIAVCAIVSIACTSGVAASWTFADKSVEAFRSDVGVNVKPFVYTPEEMPDVEVTAVQRLSDILNGKYTTENVQDSLKYLIDETIQVHWGGDPTQDPFVGSMDNDYEKQVQELFGDVLELQDEDLAFILKNQDLNGDGKNEIAMYSTSDPLDNDTDEYTGVVCVYVTVFTPILDSRGNVTGYKQVCESLRGYCYEIYYSPNNHKPSFSTDEWRTNVGYSNWGDKTIPEEEIQEVLKNQGEEAAFKLYNLSYRPSGAWRSYDTKPVGDNLSNALKGQF